MIEIMRDTKWVQFYPIESLSPLGEHFDERPLAELGESVYGKYVGGFAGYIPWWVYVTVNKNMLRTSN
jgi:hypothetical protein